MTGSDREAILREHGDLLAEFAEASGLFVRACSRGTSADAAQDLVRSMNSLLGVLDAGVRISVEPRRRKGEE
ncbi:MAG: hypothetical protein AAGA37_06615 [Actinomycetota bacterium]